MNEPIGVIGIACPDSSPLLSFISLLCSALATGNTTVIIPSEKHPAIALDMYQIFDTSDIPKGAINIVTGDRDELTKTLAEHNAVDAIWYFGTKVGSKMVEELSTSNLKQTWVNNGDEIDWFDNSRSSQMRPLLKSTQVKNIWVPYGE